jgi:hypothetical protein
MAPPGAALPIALSFPDSPSPPLNERHALQHDPSQGVSDAILAGSLVAAPAWSVPLTEVNAFLTTVSLVVGLLIGAIRLWQLWRQGH